MPIAVDIDVMLARRKMSVGELADRVGITPANLAVLKNGRAKAVRFATLAALARCSSASRATCCAGRPRTPRADDVPQGVREKRLAPPARDTALGPHGRGSPIIRSTARAPRPSAWNWWTRCRRSTPS